MSSCPSSAVEGIAAASAFGSSFLPEQAASVIAALQASTIKLLREDFLADPADMACPFFYAMARGWATRFAEHSMPERRLIRFLLCLRGALRPPAVHGGFA